MKIIDFSELDFGEMKIKKNVSEALTIFSNTMSCLLSGDNPIAKLKTIDMSAEIGYVELALEAESFPFESYILEDFVKISNLGGLFNITTETEKTILNLRFYAAFEPAYEEVV